MSDETVDALVNFFMFLMLIIAGSFVCLTTATFIHSQFIADRCPACKRTIHSEAIRCAECHWDLPKKDQPSVK